MPTTVERPISITPQMDGLSLGHPEADKDTCLAMSRLMKIRLYEEWNEIIDKKLIPWGLDPDFLRDEDLDSPAGAAIEKAIEVVSFMRERNGNLPTGVIPDGEGGLAFEFRQGNSYQRLELDERGDMRLLSFENHKLISNCVVVLP